MLRVGSASSPASEEERLLPPCPAMGPEVTRPTTPPHQGPSIVSQELVPDLGSQTEKTTHCFSMFTLDVYFTVHFTIRFSSPLATSWFMVLQILSACPAQSMGLEKNLPGVSPSHCCSFVCSCPYL